MYDNKSTSKVLFLVHGIYNLTKITYFHICVCCGMSHIATFLAFAKRSLEMPALKIAVRSTP